MLDEFFPTLMSKTFLILFLSLLVSCCGAQLVIIYFRNAYKKKEEFVFVKNNKYGEQDLVVEPRYLMRLFWPAIIINIISFIGLMAIRYSFPSNVLALSLFTFTEGLLLGIVLIGLDENLAVRVAWLTAIATFFAGTVGLYSKIDFSFLSGILFIGLIGLIGVNFIRIFIKVKGTHRKIIAFIGIAIFVGYLLYDFNKIKKLKNAAEFNNWNTAMDSSISIYLDIINLFLYILDLMSDD